MKKELVELAEHVLPAHPDKLCDATVDEIVDFVRHRDPDGQCGLEASCFFERMHLTGRVAAHQAVLDELHEALPEIVRNTYRSAGYGEDAAGHLWGPKPEDILLSTEFCWGPFEDGERELQHVSDDQAICIGYACDRPDTDFLPPAHWLARRIARKLSELRAVKGAGHVGPDGKVIVRARVHEEEWTPDHVSISLNHQERSDWLLLRRLAEEAVESACAGKATPEIALNGAGMFISGGPTGDNGLSEKNLLLTRMARPYLSEEVHGLGRIPTKWIASEVCWHENLRSNASVAV